MGPAGSCLRGSEPVGGLEGKPPKVNLLAGALSLIPHASASDWICYRPEKQFQKYPQETEGFNFRLGSCSLTSSLVAGATTSG